MPRPPPARNNWRRPPLPGSLLQDIRERNDPPQNSLQRESGYPSPQRDAYGLVVHPSPRPLPAANAAAGNEPQNDAAPINRAPSFSSSASSHNSRSASAHSNPEGGLEVELVQPSAAAATDPFTTFDELSMRRMTAPSFQPGARQQRHHRPLLLPPRTHTSSASAVSRVSTIATVSTTSSGEEQPGAAAGGLSHRYFLADAGAADDGSGYARRRSILPPRAGGHHVSSLSMPIAPSLSMSSSRFSRSDFSDEVLFVNVSVFCFFSQGTLLMLCLGPLPTA